MIFSIVALLSTAEAAPRFQPTSPCSEVAKLGGQESRAFDFYAFAVMRAYDPTIPDRKGDSPARREAFLALCETLPADTSAQKAMLALVEQHEASAAVPTELESTVREMVSVFKGHPDARLAFAAEHRPTLEEVRAIFEEPVATAVWEALPQVFDTGRIPGPSSGQNEVLIDLISTDDINRQSLAMRNLPGGFERLAGKVKPGIPMARFKFVEPGKTLGMSYDGLYKLPNRWVWIPKAWRAVER